MMVNPTDPLMNLIEIEVSPIKPYISNIIINEVESSKTFNEHLKQ